MKNPEVPAAVRFRCVVIAGTTSAIEDVCRRPFPRRVVETIDCVTRWCSFGSIPDPPSEPAEP